MSEKKAQKPSAPDAAVTTTEKPRRGTRPPLSALRRPKPAAGATTATTPAALPQNTEPDGTAKTVDDRRAMTLRLPPDMWKSLKLAGINEQRTTTDIIHDAIRTYLKAAGGTRA